MDVSRMGEMRCAYKIVVGKFEGRDEFGAQAWMKG
jgi:hypothetical protein